MKTTLCTLFEGNYHFGIAALSNSLLLSGYTGELWAGYRGDLADWIVNSPDYDPVTRRLRLTEQFTLCFVPLDTALHFTYYKPVFMRSVMQHHAPEAQTVAYIDPDIVVKCKWSELTCWFSGGIGLAEDVNGYLPARHPKRLMWNDWFAQRGWHPCRALDRYYNAGFISVPREYAAFLELWASLCDLVVDYNDGIKNIKAGLAPALFHSTDQDALNFALTACDVPLNTVGPEAMDFVHGGYYLSHAIGHPKPWHGRHIRHALRGRPPTLAGKAYYLFANHPIRVYSQLDFAMRRVSLGVASVIGRFYRKA